MSKTTVVVTDMLTKRYGDQVAVNNVNMSVDGGQIYGFLGPNGAGKTTTLRMLVGLIRPTGGSATVLGGSPGDPAIARQLGVLIEGPGFYPYLSGRDNLRVMASYRGLRAADAEDALDRVGLADRGNDKFKTYSLGMKQRLGVGSALLGRPELLILDEPTNGLDPAGMAQMRELIVDLAADGHSVLLSSHMLSEVQEICDRVGVIAGGELIAQSTVAELRGTATLFVRAEPLSQARKVVENAAPDRRVELSGNGISVDGPAADAPALARAIVDAGLDLLELRTSEKSLEDVFFEMTDGSTMEAVR